MQVEPTAAEVAASMLVAAARPLGLVVFDEQRPGLWLSDGRFFGAAVSPAAATAPGPSAPLKSKAQVFGALHDALKPQLTPVGWVGQRKEALFSRQNEETRFEIGFGCVARAPVFELALTVTVIPRFVPPWSDLAAKWGDRCHVLLDDLLTRAGVQLPGPVVQAHVRYSRVGTEWELERFARACGAALADHVLPFLRGCVAIEDLERSLNPPAGEPQVFVQSYINPIVAAYVGRPGVKALVDQCIEARRETWIKDKFRQLAADLEQLHSVR